MNIKVAAADFQLTRSLDLVTRESIESICAELKQNSSNAAVFLKQSGRRKFSALIRLKRSRGKTVVVDAEDGNLYDAIRHASHVLRRRLKKEHRKRISRRRQRTALRELALQQELAR